MLPLLSLVTFCYPLLPLLPLVTPYYTCYPLLPPITPCYPLLPPVTPCYRLVPLLPFGFVTPCYFLLPIVELSLCLFVITLNFGSFQQCWWIFPHWYMSKVEKKEKENEERFVERMSNDLKLYPGLNADLFILLMFFNRFSYHLEEQSRSAASHTNSGRNAWRSAARSNLK